jgi:hypothetical protein
MANPAHPTVDIEASQNNQDRRLDSVSAAYYSC